jgi:hypothetical protein
VAPQYSIISASTTGPIHYHYQYRLRAGRSCWSMGTAAASAGAAGPFRDYGPDGAAATRTSGAGRRVSPMHGTRSQTRLHAKVRRGQGLVPFIIVCEDCFWMTTNDASVSGFGIRIHLSSNRFNDILDRFGVAI